MRTGQVLMEAGDQAPPARIAFERCEMLALFQVIQVRETQIQGPVEQVERPVYLSDIGGRTGGIPGHPGLG